MAINVNGTQYDTLSEAEKRLKLARKTILTYIENGTFTEPDRKLQGTRQLVRYFTPDWYEANEAILANLRGEATTDSIAEASNSNEGQPANAEVEIASKQTDEDGQSTG